MQVNRIATMFIETAEALDSVESMAKTMRDSGVGLVVVVDGGRPVGIVTDRDIVTRVIAPGKDPRWLRAEAVMSQPVHFVFSDAEHDSACRMMMDHSIRRVIVCDHDRRPVGVLSLDDLALFGRGDETVGRVLEHIVAPQIAGEVLG